MLEWLGHRWPCGLSSSFTVSLACQQWGCEQYVACRCVRLQSEMTWNASFPVEDWWFFPGIQAIHFNTVFEEFSPSTEGRGAGKKNICDRQLKTSQSRLLLFQSNENIHLWFSYTQMSKLRLVDILIRLVQCFKTSLKYHGIVDCNCAVASCCKCLKCKPWHWRQMSSN